MALVRSGAIGSDAIQFAAGELWPGSLAIEGMHYGVGVTRDERAREWRAAPARFAYRKTVKIQRAVEA